MLTPSHCRSFAATPLRAAKRHLDVLPTVSSDVAHDLLRRADALLNAKEPSAAERDALWKDICATIRASAAAEKPNDRHAQEADMPKSRRERHPTTNGPSLQDTDQRGARIDDAVVGFRRYPTST